MKLVRESVKDVLVPKSKETYEQAEKEVLEYVMNSLDWMKKEIEFLKSSKKDINLAEWKQRWQGVYHELLDLQDNLPDYIYKKLSKLIDSVYSQLQSIHLLESSSPKITISAGFVIIQDNKILLVHPTNSKWFGTYSIPKGQVEEGEDLLETALRETKEEIGIEINKDDIISGPHLINYKNDNNVFKRVYYYVIKPKKSIIKDDFNLQKNEVDWAGFLTKEDAKKRIFWRLNEILNYLK